MLSLVDAALRGAVVVLALLLAAMLGRELRHSLLARAGIALSLGLVVQTVSSTPAFEETVPLVWQVPLVAVSVGNAVLFWIFVQSLFDDDFVFRPVHAAAWLAAALLSGINCALGTSGGLFAPFGYAIQRAVPAVCAVLAAWAALAHWRDDLLEERRRLRGFILVTGVVYTLVSLAARLGSPHGRFDAATAAADTVFLAAMLAGIAWQLLRVGRSAFFDDSSPAGQAVPAAPVLPVLPAPHVAGPAALPVAEPSSDPEEERLAVALQRHMAGGAFRGENLTVASLASSLRVPEYRLRRLINRRLGHRNFNAYVNAFRLEAARAALADPARRDVPVLSIALDAGFQSIGPFNRAFKATTGRTPSEFRREQLADS